MKELNAEKSFLVTNKDAFKVAAAELHSKFEQSLHESCTKHMHTKSTLKH